MDFYKKNHSSYIASTLNADMGKVYPFFEKYLRPGDSILDLGFGSGRDTIHFASKYEVTSLDPCLEFCNALKEKGYKNILQMRAEDIDFSKRFDAIWASASLLHISSKELNGVYNKLDRALKDNGVLYCSFKYGDFEGMRDERPYLDLTEKSLLPYLEGTSFYLKEWIITDDVRPDHKEKWLNCLLLKK
ncbi:MAG: class I SAM-dependent methyltransferase [Bacilli bacterium]|nr:class I SAM-dependent methyltransferase [Bacilli bacterium]